MLALLRGEEGGAGGASWRTEMLAASSRATQELFNEYRGSMFAVGVSNTNAINQLSTDAMTWDSLIHTTYFDQPEVADMIAVHIVGERAAARSAWPLRMRPLKLQRWSGRAAGGCSGGVGPRAACRLLPAGRGHLR